MVENWTSKEEAFVKKFDQIIENDKSQKVSFSNSQEGLDWLKKP